MKVINEASSQQIRQAEGDFLNANGVEEKAKIVKDFLASIDSAIPNKLSKISDAIIANWADAMKWDELGRGNNEFIEILKSGDYGNDSPPFNSTENFIKLYNAYSDGSIENSYINDEIFPILVKNPNLYKFKDEEVRYIIKTYDNLKSSGANDNKIKEILFEDPTLTDSNEINSPAKINSILGNKSKAPEKINDEAKNMSTEDALNMLKALMNRKDLGETPIAIMNKLGLIR